MDKIVRSPDKTKGKDSTIDPLREGISNQSPDKQSSSWRKQLRFANTSKGDLYQKIMGEDPSHRPSKDVRLQELIERRNAAISSFSAALSETQIEDSAKQMLQEKQRIILKDSATLEEVARTASYQRRYRAEKNLQANIMALQALERQAREGIPDSSASETSLQRIISERTKLQEAFLEEAEKYAKKDLNTHEEFLKLFNTTVIPDENDKNIFKVISSTKGIENKSYFISEINVEAGTFKNVTSQKKSKIQYPFSEIAFNQLLEALKKSGKKLSQFDPKEWCDMQVVNKDVRAIFPYIREKKIDGSNEYVTGARTHQRGSSRFNALRLSELGQSKGFWEAQHQEAFKGKRFTSVTEDLEKWPTSSEGDEADDQLNKYILILTWKIDD